MSSINDVADLAGVSISTVSRVINNHPNVSQEKREAVGEAIEELNYIPNALAQGLVTKSTNSIGILIADIANDFYSILVRSIEDVLNKKGYFTVIGNTDWNQEKEENYINYFKQKQVDGFILASTTLEESFINEIASELPLVVLDRNIESDVVDKIRVDDVKGGYMATEHLIEAGYQKLVHFQGPKNIASAEDRKKGFLTCIEDYNISKKNVEIIQGCFMEKCGYQGIKKYLEGKELDQSTGIFAANDAMAFGVLKYLKKKKIDCPGEIGIVGFDDVDFAEYSNPSLTTIKRPILEVGKIAARTLLDRLKADKEHFQQDVKLNVKLINRNSTTSL